MKFRIYRYNPDTDTEPYMQAFEVETHRGMMLREALLQVKEQDESFAFRHSCGEGVCGSDGVNVNGQNKLACITPLSELKEPVENGGVMRGRRIDLASAEVRSHLDAGMQVAKLAIEWQERIRCIVGDDLGIRRLRFLDLVMDEAAETEVDDAIALGDDDVDGDGLLNWLDTDSDDDGVLDMHAQQSRFFFATEGVSSKNS